MQCKDCNTKNTVSINNKDYCGDCGNRVENSAPNPPERNTPNNILDLSKLAKTPSSTRPSTRVETTVPQPKEAKPGADSQLKSFSHADKKARRVQKLNQVQRSNSISKFPKPKVVPNASKPTDDGVRTFEPAPQLPDTGPKFAEQPSANLLSQASPNPQPIAPTMVKSVHANYEPGKKSLLNSVAPGKTSNNQAPTATTALPVGGPARSVTNATSGLMDGLGATPAAPKPGGSKLRKEKQVSPTPPPPKPSSTKMEPDQDYKVKEPTKNTAQEVKKAVEASRAHRAEVKPKTGFFTKLSHAFTTPFKHKPRTSSIFASFAILLLLGGYITYLNLPNLTLRVAASRAGFSAQMPHYTPSGFEMSGPITYGPGQITLTFGNNTGNLITVKQRKTDWDSESLLANYVTPKTELYSIAQEKGLKIYLFDNNSNAAWVNKGIWYTIETTGSLNTEQLLLMASSL